MGTKHFTSSNTDFLKYRLAHIIRSSFRFYRPALFMYVIQAALGLIIGLQVFQVLESSFGTSMAREALLEGFDRTTFADLFNYHGGSLGPIIGIFRWIILFYIPVYLFLQSGLIYSLLFNKKDLLSFIYGGARYFKTIALLSLMALVCMLVTSIVVWSVFLVLSDNPIEGVVSEAPFFYQIIGVMVLWVFLMPAIWFPFFVAKCLSIKDELNISQAIQKGFQLGLSSFKSLFALTLSVMGFQLLLIVAGNFISEDRGAYSYGFIFFVFLLQQVFILLRIFVKVFFYKSIIFLTTKTLIE
jgi:hypothetical protein